MPYIQGLEIALTELTDPDEISAASAYIDAKKADLEDNYIGVAQDTYIELQVTVPIATARSNAAQAIGIDNIEYVGMNENVPAKELAPDSNQAMMESGQAAILNITERMATPSTRASTINSVIKIMIVSAHVTMHATGHARTVPCMIMLHATIQSIHFMRQMIAQILSLNASFMVGFLQTVNGSHILSPGKQQAMLGMASASI